MTFVAGVIVGAILLLALDMRAHVRIAALEGRLDALAATFTRKAG